MHRKNLLKLLASYKPPTSEEIVYKEMIQDFIYAHPGCFDRSEQIGHITASALLLNKDRSKVLLTHHKKLNKWLQLGGHCDGNPDILEVAFKEAREESGIKNINVISPEIFDIGIHLIPANSKEKAHYHYDIRFLLHIDAEEKDIVISDESNDLKWFSSNECPSEAQSINRLFKKWSNLLSNEKRK